jgi:hypothetical protein
MPRPDNADYLWIQRFCAASSQKSRAGFVRANSASDAWQWEQEIGKEFLQAGHTRSRCPVPFGSSTGEGRHAARADGAIPRLAARLPSGVLRTPQVHLPKEYLTRSSLLRQGNADVTRNESHAPGERSRERIVRLSIFVIFDSRPLCSETKPAARVAFWMEVEKDKTLEPIAGLEDFRNLRAEILQSINRAGGGP